MNLVIRKIGRCPPFSHMGDLLNTCMLWIGLFECHILLENPVEFRYEPEFWLSFRFRSTESGIFKNTTPVPAQPEPDFQYIRYPAGYSGSVSGLVVNASIQSNLTGQNILFMEDTGVKLLNGKTVQVATPQKQLPLCTMSLDDYFDLIPTDG